MTDMERFIELYKSLGIELKVEYRQWRNVPEPVQLITITEGDHPQIGGYAGFGTTIEFDMQGKFIRQDFWE